MTEDELTSEQQHALSEARASIAPPRQLERDAVAALRERGLIGPPRRALTFGWLALAAAAIALVTFVALRPGPRPVHGPRFVLLLYAGSTEAEGSRRAEYSAWARDVSARGISISGEELAGSGSTIAGNGTITIAPDAELRGFFIVAVDDLAAAQRVAASCPHLRYGGRIVVRPLA